MYRFMFLFIAGATPVSYSFPEDGTYNLKFSDDWNEILAVTEQIEVGEDV